MKFVLRLIFIACFVIGDDIFGTNAKQAVGAVKVPLLSVLKDVLQALIDKILIIGKNQSNGHGQHEDHDYDGNHEDGNGDNPYHTKKCIALIGEYCGFGLCCEGYCDSTKTCACFNVTGACKLDKDCCTLNCSKGHCACREKGADCRESSDCCVGICRNGACGICLIDQEACKQSSNCCRGKCNIINKQCECQLLGRPCTSPHDCCGGTCDEGKCECLPYNSACDPEMPNSCCFGTCNPSNPGQYRCRSSPENAVCNADNDCDSSVCKKNRCSCSIVGETCNFSPLQCCGGLSCNAATSQCQK